ncbi:MAG: hypothetical protein JKY61_06600 [Planctomycetes bacterium]|nr:hypothetical protein [Planctomycetota bacterium]
MQVGPTSANPRVTTNQRILAICGGFVVLAVHAFFGMLYMLGSTLPAFDGHSTLYWAAVAIPFSLMAGVAWARRRVFPGRTGHWVYKAWLKAFIPAVVLAVLALYFNWPITLKGWDGHGFGASGAEGNAMLFPWLHTILWIGSGPLSHKFQSRS